MHHYVCSPDGDRSRSQACGSHVERGRHLRRERRRVGVLQGRQAGRRGRVGGPALGPTRYAQGHVRELELSTLIGMYVRAAQSSPGLLALGFFCTPDENYAGFRVLSIASVRSSRVKGLLTYSSKPFSRKSSRSPGMA